MMGRMSRRSRTGSTGVDSPERVLLLADDPLALVDEAHGDRVRDPVGGGLVRVKDLVEQGEVMLVLLEERPGQHVAEQEHDADDLMRLDAPRDDPLGKVARVVLQSLDVPVSSTST